MTADRVDWRAEQTHSCGRKLKYLDPADAHAAARRARAKGEAVRAYPCPWCCEFHIGHVPSLESLERLAVALRARREELGRCQR